MATSTKSKSKSKPKQSEIDADRRETEARNAAAEGDDDLQIDDVDDMFDDWDDDPDDLLNEVIEDDSEGWVPEDAGDGVSGIVLKVGETTSDFEDDPEKAKVPMITIQTKDGTKLRITGYGAVLRRELYDAKPEVGDLLAVKYFGEKPLKKGKFAGKMYKHFGVAVRRAKHKPVED